MHSRSGCGSSSERRRHASRHRKTWFVVRTASPPNGGPIPLSGNLKPLALAGGEFTIAPSMVLCLRTSVILAIVQGGSYA